MKITVVGSGGVGGYYGGRLALAGADVTFVARGAHKAAINAGGLQLELTGENRTETVRSPARELSELAGPLDLVLYCIKTTQDAELLPALASLCGPTTWILPLQNGVEAEEKLKKVCPGAQILGGTCYVSALLEGPGKVRHYGSGLVTAGDIGMSGSGTAGKLEAIRDLFNRAKIPTSISANIRLDKWRKLVWNAGLNPLTALTNLLATDVITNPDTRQLARDGMIECIRVAQALDLPLTDADADRHLAGTATIKTVPTSMLSDRRAGKPVEIDAISGPIIRNGEKHSISTPVARMYLTLLSGYNRSLESAGKP
ncbi:MAG: 2-dehydropantoate 2-reductase [Deltaproteobacteria bacterium]|nr:2-dehydropantoate 2-reductase [Deltaproteobacteria bacterium]